MESTHSYVRKRRDFGKHADFSSQDADVLFDLRPNEEYAQEHMQRATVDKAVQAVPDMCQHQANTAAVVYATASMSHTEGGWPKEVDATEAESTIRYRKKIETAKYCMRKVMQLAGMMKGLANKLSSSGISIEKDEYYIKTVVRLAGVVEGLIKSNNAIDIHEEYFPEPPPEPSGGGVASAATVAELTDSTGAKRGAQYLSWHPDGSRRLAVAYSILEFQKQPADMPLASALWDLADTTQPETLLQPTSQLTCINYNLRDSNVVGAGMYNGQFGVFDPRKGTGVAEVSPLEHSHREPVFDFAWQQSKTGTEAMTVSTDGRVLWWDIRLLGEPLESLVLTDKTSDSPLSGMSLDYTMAAGPTKFLVGTERGAVLSCNRKGKTPADRIVATFSGHHAAVYSVARHPVFTKYFLSVGDWSTRVLNEDIKTPVIVSPYQDTYLRAGRWSPTRPGVFFVARADGTLDVWDYFDKQHEPVLSLKVSKAALTSVRVRERGTEVAVGAADGTVSLLRLSAALFEPQPNEKATMSAMLERESSREKNLEKIAKDAKIRARRAAEAAKAAKVDPASEAEQAEAIARAEAEYYAAIGIPPPPPASKHAEQEPNDDSGTAQDAT